MRKELARYLMEEGEEYKVSLNPKARFEGLAAELRLQIYEYHFEYLEDRARSYKRIMLPQPPITRVSKKLRREALPNFYDRLHIHYLYGTGQHSAFDKDQIAPSVPLLDAGTDEVPHGSWETAVARNSFRKYSDSWSCPSRDFTLSPRPLR